MSLIDSYDLVDKAEKLAIKHQFKQASQLFNEAATNFQKLVESSENKEIQNALKILAQQHFKRGEELLIVERNRSRLPTQTQTQTQAQAQAQAQTPSVISQQLQQRVRSNINQPSSISSSLANARGVSNNSINNSVNNLSDTTVLEGSDPVTKFQIQVYNLVRAPNLNLLTDNSSKPLTIKPTGKTVEELELENATLKQLLTSYSENLQGYESFHKKVKQSLKSYLTILKRDLQQQELEKKQEYENKLDSLVKENKKLELQTTKLKQRWNELVESAKRRRDDKSKS